MRYRSRRVSMIVFVQKRRLVKSAEEAAGDVPHCVGRGPAPGAGETGWFEEGCEGNWVACGYWAVDTGAIVSGMKSPGSSMSMSPWVCSSLWACWRSPRPDMADDDAAFWIG